MAQLQDLKLDDIDALARTVRGNNGELKNPYTGMGMQGHDPTLETELAYTNSYAYNQEIFEEYCRTFRVLRKIVEIIPNQMTRRWGHLTLTQDTDSYGEIEKIHDWMRDMPVTTLFEETNGVDYAFNIAQKNANRCGNGAIILLANDGEEDPSMPLNINRLQDITGMHVTDRWYLQPDTSFYFRTQFQHYRLVQYDQTAKFLGQSARIYQLIHRSRVLWFRGDELSDRQLQRSGGLDDSILCGAINAFKRFQSGMQGAGRMIIDFEVLNHKVKGLLAGLEGDGSETSEYEKKMNKRMLINKMARSLFNMYLTDMDEEEIDSHTRTVTGYAELIETLIDDLLSQTDLKPHELFNKFPQGMNATGKFEQQDSNDRTEAYQGLKFQKNVNRLIKLAILAKRGPTKGKDIGSWKWKWFPLHPRTEEEIANLYFKVAQADGLNIRNEVITAEEAAKSHHSTNELEVGLNIDFDERERKAKELAKQQEQEQGFDFAALFGEENDEGGSQQPGQPPPGQPQQQRTDDSTPVKRVLDWHGRKVGLQYLPFEKRHGRVIPVGYGHFRGIPGADGMAADVYVGTNLKRKKAYAVTQLTKDGEFDEIKFFIGVDGTKAEIEALYKQMMPAEFFGGCKQVAFNKIPEVAMFAPKKTDALDS